MLSKKALNRIIKLFGYPKEEVEGAVESFIGLVNGSKKAQKVRLQLLEICALSDSSHDRWIKARNHLIKNLETQIGFLIFSQPGDLYLNHFKPLEYHIIQNILDQNSFIFQCIKSVSLFNALSIEDSLPKDCVIELSRHSLIWDWSLKYPRHLGKMRIYLRDGRIFEELIPIEERHSSEIRRGINRIVIDVIERTHKKLKNKEDTILTWDRLKKDNDSVNIIKRKTGIDISKEKKYFYTSPLFKKYFPGLKEIIYFRYDLMPKYQFYDHLINPDSLSKELVDIYLSKLDYEKRMLVLNRALDKNGYEITLLASFQNIMYEWGKDKQNERIEGIFDKLHKYYSPTNTKKKENDRRLWLIFFMIEDLAREEKCTIYKACNDIGKRAITEKDKVDPGRSIRSRYYEIRKKIKEEKLIADDIKDSYGWSAKSFRELLIEYNRSYNNSDYS